MSESDKNGLQLRIERICSDLKDEADYFREEGTITTVTRCEAAIELIRDLARHSAASSVDQQYAASLADAVENCRVTCKHEPSAFDLEQQGYDTIIRALRLFARSSARSSLLYDAVQHVLNMTNLSHAEIREVLRAALTQPAHTDHPARHFDRTCPACIAESGELFKDAKIGATLNDDGSVTPAHPAVSHASSNVEEAQAAEIAELREKLAQYEVPARRRARLEQIVSFLFPKYDGRKGRDEGVLIHPDKSWWWNGAGIDENDVYVGDTGYGAQCKVSSYVGSGEYDSFLLEVPAAWMDAEDFRPLASKWITDETERRESANKAAEKAAAERNLKDAQRRLDEANNTPIAASATRTSDGDAK